MTDPTTTDETGPDESTPEAGAAARTFTLHQFPEKLAVVRLAPGAEIPQWAESSSLFSITATATETSLVCASRSVPTKTPSQKPFTAFAVQGPLDFALTGVLSDLLAPLAEAEISVFTISTFDTDWILVPVVRADDAAEAWRRSGAHRRRRRPRRPRQEDLLEGLDQEEQEMTVTTPAGFVAAGVPAGLKSSGGKDLALVVNQGPTFDSASVFTANRCKANPILWSQEVVKDGVVRAVVLNSGGANCYTGPDGFQTTHAVAEQVATRLGIGADRRRRLLDRADRPGQPPREPARPASTRPTPRSPPTGERTPPRRS